MQLKGIMVTRVVTISKDQTVAAAASRMREENIGCLVVSNADPLEGIVTDRDLLMGCLGDSHDPWQCPVSRHIRSPVVTAEPTMEIQDAAHMMVSMKIKRLPVVEPGQLVGLVSIADIGHSMGVRLGDGASWSGRYIARPQACFPLREIHAWAEEEGTPLPEIRTAVRTADTKAYERQKMAKQPPHILITTPESLYILLTSQSGRKSLSGVKTLILDEIHAVADDKRGSHLALSVERLCALAEGPITRIGLSATQRPIEEMARLPNCRCGPREGQGPGPPASTERAGPHCQP